MERSSEFEEKWKFECCRGNVSRAEDVLAVFEAEEEEEEEETLRAEKDEKEEEEVEESVAAAARLE